MGIGRRRRAARLTAAAVGVALTLAACAPQPDGRTPTGPSPTASAPTSPPPVDQPTPITPMPSTQSPMPSPEPTFDRSLHPIDDPASPWVVVNKLRPLDPIDYEAPDLVSVPVPQVNSSLLRQRASDAAVAMFEAASDEGLQLASQSAYRSYSTQVRVYNGWVNELGQAEADLTSARPGHSEHQTGLAIDIASVPANCTLDQCFGDTAHGRWLAENAWRFGFVVRYPEGATAVTGYEYEPWHFRWVGKDLAAELRDSGAETLEEFFGLPPAPDYAG